MPHTLVIFGASGDLTSRKLIPALYRLFQKERLPAETRIVGVSRTEYSDDAWRDQLAESTAKFTGKGFSADSWRAFAQNVHYQPGDVGQSEAFDALGQRLEQLEGGAATPRVYYLSTSPKLYEKAIAQLGAARLAEQDGPSRRVVIEKPFGTDLESARALNDAVHHVFHEENVYRIDHYLGKETVQNLLVLRFANSIFEPLWNRHFVDHVQITVAEEVVVGDRGGYYDHSGVLRDMFQNHLLQLATITCMEAPAKFDAQLVRDEKVKVLRAVKPLEGEAALAASVRGQYENYRQESETDPESRTATFAGLELHVENWRWQGVPIYLRSGKAMSCRTTQIVIQFRQPPLTLFGREGATACDANRLVIQVQPAEGIQLHFASKVPDAGMKLTMTDLDFRFRRAYGDGSLPDAYQRLLLDALQGDASLFARSDEVEQAWRIIDPIQAAWDSASEPPALYERGMWGPACSNDWMADRGRAWFDVCPVLH